MSETKKSPVLLAGLAGGGAALLVAVAAAVYFLFFSTDAPTEARVRLQQLGAPFEQTAFIEAIRRSDPVLVDLYLTAGMSPAALDSDGNSALTIAARDGQAAMVERLVHSGASVDGEPGRSGITPLVAAVFEGHEDIVGMLLDNGTAIGRRLSTGLSALDIAVLADDATMLGHLAEAGAPVNEAGTYPQTLLDRIASRPAGAPLNSVIDHDRLGTGAQGAGTYEMTPLALAIPRGSSDLMRLLIEQGADANAEIAFGQERVPLLFSALGPNTADRTAKVSLLLEAGAAVSLDDRTMTDTITGFISDDREMALVLIGAGEGGAAPIRADMVRAALQVDDAEIVAAVLDKGDLASLDEPGAQALLIAAMNSTQEDGSYERVQMLLDVGLPVHLSGEDGSPLMRAIETGDWRLASKLLEAAGEDDVQLLGDLLRRVIAMNRVEGIPVLLEAGADIGIVDAEGRTLLFEAVASGNSQIVAMLLEDGVPLDGDGLATSSELLSHALTAGPRTSRSQIALMLLDAGAKMEVDPARVAASPLALAMSLGDEELMERLHGEIGTLDEHQATALLTWNLAARQADWIAVLLEAGADPAAEDEEGITLLGHAYGLQENTRPEAMRLLLQAGAGVPLAGTRPENLVLARALRDGDETTALHLLDHVDDDDASALLPALRDAVGGGYRQVATRLLETGVHEAWPETGEPLGIWAYKSDRGNELIDLLAAQGVDLETLHEEDVTLFWHAWNSGDSAAMEKLSALGVEDRRTPERASRDVFAAQSRDDLLQVLDHLQSIGAFPDSPVDGRLRPMVVAARSGQDDVIDRLMAMQVPIGMDAVKIAQENGHGTTANRLMGLIIQGNVPVIAPRIEPDDVKPIPRNAYRITRIEPAIPAAQAVVDTQQRLEPSGGRVADASADVSRLAPARPAGEVVSEAEQVSDEPSASADDSSAGPASLAAAVTGRQVEESRTADRAPPDDGGTDRAVQATPLLADEADEDLTPEAAHENAPDSVVMPTQAADQDAPRQRAILYQERTDEERGTADEGTVVWTLLSEQETSGHVLPAIRAEVTIPGRDMRMQLTFRPQRTAAYPESEIAELVFALPDDFAEGAVSGAPRISFKSDEADTGTALTAAPSKTDGSFVFVLGNGSADRRANLEMMDDMGWIDVPVTYDSGRRAIWTLEKGPAGDQVFEEALRAWRETDARNDSRFGPDDAAAGDGAIQEGDEPQQSAIAPRNHADLSDLMHSVIDMARNSELVGQLRTATATANIRSGPSTSAAIVGQMTAGDFVHVLGDAGADWFRIGYYTEDFLDGDAYIHRDLVTAEDGPAAISALLVPEEAARWVLGSHPYASAAWPQSMNSLAFVDLNGNGLQEAILVLSPLDSGEELSRQRLFVIDGGDIAGQPLAQPVLLDLEYRASESTIGLGSAGEGGYRDLHLMDADQTRLAWNGGEYADSAGALPQSRPEASPAVAAPVQLSAATIDITPEAIDEAAAMALLGPEAVRQMREDDTRISVAWQDVTGNGQDELVVLMEGPAWTGSMGARWIVLEGAMSNFDMGGDDGVLLETLSHGLSLRSSPDGSGPILIETGRDGQIEHRLGEGSPSADVGAAHDVHGSAASDVEAAAAATTDVEQASAIAPDAVASPVRTISLSPEAEREMNRWIADVCGDAGGRVAEHALFEGDLTGRGNLDFLMDIHGVECAGGRPNEFCVGFEETCEMVVYVRDKNRLEAVRRLITYPWPDGTRYRVEPGEPPVIRSNHPDGSSPAVSWNAGEFRWLRE